MKKQHHPTLKFHTMYSIFISVIFIIIVLLEREVTLVASAIFLIFYVAGNGIIHANANKLERDTLIEYIILAIIALVILFGAVY